MQCCDTDGCNWSWETASNNQAIGALTSGGTTDSVAVTYIGVAVAIFAIILLCLLGCFIYYWRSNKEEEEDYDEDKVMQDRFYGRQRSNFNYSNFNNYESRRDSGESLGRSLGRGGSSLSTPSTVASQARRISVREATPDHERAMYNYDFKDKWDKSLATAGMSSSLEPPDLGYDREQRRQRNKSINSSVESSAWGQRQCLMGHN